jgi:outer membrane receptor protein involved in Fe transport
MSRRFGSWSDRWRVVFVVAALLTLAVPAARAQSASGSIQGTVVDSSGGVLPGVTVTVNNSAAGITRSVVTDQAGEFRAELLPVGTYEVAAELSGFAPVKQSNVNLTIGATLTLQVELRVANVAETVTVSGAAPIIETTRSQMSDTVGQAAIQNLPVNGRNFIDFALLTPGVTKDVRTGDISFAGQRGTLNSLVIDGADSNNTFFGQSLGRTGSGRAPYQFSQDAVQEFQVNSNAYSAEYGRAGGAVINVVTKSGTNSPSGSAFEFFRDKALNANDALSVQRGLAKRPYHYNQFGATFGGPIQRDVHFVFLNYDGQRNTQPNPVFLNVPASTPGDADTQAALAKLQPLATSWNQGRNQNVFLVKTDSQLAKDHRLTLRYNHQNFTGLNFENSGSQNSEQHTGNSNVFTRTLNGTLASVLGSTMFNEARVQYARDSEPGQSNSELPEAIVRQAGSTVLTIGRNSFSPRETTIKRWQVADTFTVVKGPHKLKAGADVQADDILNYFPGNFFGAYSFQTLASFNRGAPNGANESYTQAFAGAGTTGGTTHPDIREYSVFGQDEWRVSKEVTINAGVRYDVQKFAKPPIKNPDPQLAAAGLDTSVLKTDTNNVGPRFGVAYSPTGRPFVVRGGYGLFYGRTTSIMVGTAHSNNGINVQTITFAGNLVPTYPNIFSSLPTGATLPRPTIFVFDPSFENPRVQQASTGLEYQLSPTSSLTLSYLFVRGDSLPRSIDINIGPASVVTYTIAGSNQTVTYPRFAAGPFTNFQRVIEFQSSAYSRYNGFTIELNRRMANSVQFRAAYTLGKVIDTVPDATAVVPNSAGDDAKYASDPADFEVDRTVGNNDQRHRFVASGVWDSTSVVGSRAGVSRAILGGWSLSAILTTQSGQPYSARVGAIDLNGDLNTRNDLAPGTTRNQFNLPAQTTLDLRVARTFGLGGAKLTTIAEAFNLLNRTNISSVNTTYYNPTLATGLLTPVSAFGQMLGVSDPRIAQLALKIAF